MAEKNADAKSPGVLQAYEFQSRHFSMINENFFKRVHVFMAAAEGALLALAFATIPGVAKEHELTVALVMLIGIALLGVIVAITWRVLGKRQVQAAEHCRRVLRQLEAMARRKGIPLCCHTCEAWVLSPGGAMEKPKNGLGMEYVGTEKSAERVIKFTDTKEQFPDENQKQNWYTKKEVRGGVGPLEVNFSIGFLVLWIVTAIVATLALLQAA